MRCSINRYDLSAKKDIKAKLLSEVSLWEELKVRKKIIPWKSVITTVKETDMNSGDEIYE